MSTLSLTLGGGSTDGPVETYCLVTKIAFDHATLLARSLYQAASFGNFEGSTSFENRLSETNMIASRAFEAVVTGKNELLFSIDSRVEEMVDEVN